MRETKTGALLRPALTLSLGLAAALALSCSGDASGTPDASTGGGSQAGTGGGSAATGGGTAATGGGTASTGGGSSSVGGGTASAGGGTAAVGGGTAATGGGTSTNDGGSSDGGFTGCPNATSFFCEDFESRAMGAAQDNNEWTTEVANGTLTIDNGQAHGTRALHVHTTDNGRARIFVKNFSPPDAGFYGRMFVYVTAFPTAPDYAHFSMVEASGTGNTTLVRPYGGQFIPTSGGGLNKAELGIGSDQGPTGDWINVKTSAPGIPGRFVCVEWQLDSTTDDVNLWFDNVAQSALDTTKTVHGGNAVDFIFPTFNSLWIGWWLYQSGTTPGEFDVWYDDIQLSMKRIGGC